MSLGNVSVLLARLAGSLDTPPLAPASTSPANGEHRVISHVFIGTNHFERALGFYEPLMAALGIQARFCERERPWAGWQSSLDPRPLFLLGRPFDGQPHEPGNGQMVALLAPDRRAVDRAYAIGLAHGGSSEGAPGPRPQYHEHYYGAYLRDPDGNKLGIVCHRAPG